MFDDHEPEPLPWDYFLTEYERDLLTLTLEGVARKYPDRTPEELNTEMEQMRASQAVFVDFCHIPP